MTDEDLGYKPSIVEQAKFGYSPFGKVFNKGLTEEDKKEGLLKRLRNFESKNKEQSKAIEDRGKKQLDAVKNIETDSKSLKAIIFFSELSPKEKKLLGKIKKEKNTIGSENLFV